MVRDTCYCHNCGHWSHLADGVYCDWCYRFWQLTRRMPRYGDEMPATAAR